MDVEKAEEEFIEVFKTMYDSVVAKGNKPGEDVGLISAIVYLGAKVDELINAIEDLKKKE